MRSEARQTRLPARRSINSLFNRCYGSDILPSRAQFPRSFQHEDVFANLYLSERQWVDEVDFAPEQGPERHELYLDELFWSRDVVHPLICVLGPVGSGKSTLVDYYLRCYCGTKGRNRAEFDKKLIVHFDSKVIQDNTDFYHDFFLFAQSSIRYQCSQKGFEIDVAIKRRPTQPNNVREWVWAALEELTRHRREERPGRAVSPHRAGGRQPGSNSAGCADPGDHRGGTVAANTLDQALAQCSCRCGRARITHFATTGLTCCAGRTCSGSARSSTTS